MMKCVILDKEILKLQAEIFKPTLNLLKPELKKK